MKNVIILSIGLLISNFFISPVHAQTSTALQVSPVIFNITLSPGRISRYELKIKNSLDVSVPIRIRVENLDIMQNDESGTNSLRSITSWVAIPEQDMILAPKSERTVPFSVNVPKKIELGGYYGMIYLRPVVSAASPGNVSSKIGILLLGSIGVPDIPLNKIDLVSPRFSRPIYHGKDIKMQFSIKNNSLNHFSAKPFVRIKSLMGTSQYVVMEEKIIFPGRVREWIVPITLQNYPHLLYRAEFTVSVGMGEQKKAVLYFVSFPIIQILLTVFGIVIAGAGIKYRARLGKALRAFIKG